MKKFLSIIAAVFLVGIACNAQAYQALMNDDGTLRELDINGSGWDYKIADFIGTGYTDLTYYGYLGLNSAGSWTGYYIGTVVAEYPKDNANTEPNAFKDLVNYYLGGNVPDFQYFKYDGGADGPLDVESSDGWLSGKWILDSGYSIGFYAVKATEMFAMYYIPPDFSHNSETEGEIYGYWTTDHVGGGDNELSHLSVASVPEPTTMLLLGTGLIGLVVIRGRRFIK